MGYTKVIKSGDIVEVYIYERTPAPVGPRKRKRASGSGERDSNTPLRRKDNLRRLQKGFIRLVRSNLEGSGAPAFLTLTMRDVVSLDDAGVYFKGFTKAIRSNYGTGVRYIAVPEFQKRGAVHYHVLVWGLPDDVIFNEAPYVAWCKQSYKRPGTVKRFLEWCIERQKNPRESRGVRALQHCWQAGYLDCVPTDGSPKLAGYLAKYMYKAMQDERLFRRRAFLCSRNVLRPVLFTSSLVLNSAPLIWGNELTLLTTREFSTEWSGAAHYKRFTLGSVDHE